MIMKYLTFPLLLFISATLAYTLPLLAGEVRVFDPDCVKCELVIILPDLTDPSCCLWKSSSSSAAVMRLDVGLARIEAVLG